MDTEKLIKTTAKAEKWPRSSPSPGGDNRPGIERIGAEPKARATAYLDGNFARRKLPGVTEPFEIMDVVLAGFGMRVRPSGVRTWFVRYKQRGRHRRVSLGRVDVMGADVARIEARKALARVALDGLPERIVARSGPNLSVYCDEFWADYAHHWKRSTQARNLSVLKHHILPAFGHLAVDVIARVDVVRWRDGCATKCEASFNRALPVLAAMLKYAEQLGYRAKNSNPCRGIARFKVQPKERYLSPVEYRRLGRELDLVAGDFPLNVAVIRLLLYTGARFREILDLRWNWVDDDCLRLPDSKTGAKTIRLNSQARAILDGLDHRQGCPFVFPNGAGTGAVSIDTWWRTFRRRCALPDLRIHDLRHSFASLAIRENIPLATIGALLGHRLPETTARYAHLADDVIADAASRVSGDLARAIGLGR